jgi:squalene-hopene/tetraprenyl-beta-curcumene cyclase
MKRILFPSCFALCIALNSSPAINTPVTPTTPTTPINLSAAQAPDAMIDISLMNEARSAQKRGLDWLATLQNNDGSWSTPDFPALTALPLWAFALSDYPNKGPIVSNAVHCILQYVQPNGGIYKPAEGKTGGLANYNTAIAMVALHLTGDRSLTPIVLKARKFIADSQHLEGDDMYKGGMGYDKSTGRSYADLSSSVVAYEAMRLTQGAEDLRPADEKKADLDWQAATQFLAKVQNPPSAGAENAGGFSYRPDESKAGTVTNAEGAIVLRSYGSMSYAGLLSLIYAEVDRNDPRVKSAFDWAMNHWSLEENPGMGTQGLFYFYNIMSKSLATFGRDVLPVPNSTPIAWRKAMIEKVISLQKTDEKTGAGYWVNQNNRWMEGDPILVTSYSLIALNIAVGGR